MLARFGGGDRILFVLAGRGRDVNSFNLGITQALGKLAIGEGMAGFELLSEFLGLRSCPR